VLPVASTMVLGQRFTIHNNSTGNLTINSSGSNLVGTVQANMSVIITCISTSGTSAASWDFDITGFSSQLPTTRGGTGLTTLGTANQVLAVNSGATALEFQTVAAGGTGVPPNNIYLTGTGTYTKTTGAKYILFSISGGGGGGGGAWPGSGSGNAGNASSFSTYMTATAGNGGAGGQPCSNVANGNNGTTTVGSGAVALGNSTGNGVRVGIISYATATSGGGGGGSFDGNCYSEGCGTRYAGSGGSSGGTTAKLDVSSLSTIAFTAGNAGNGGGGGSYYSCVGNAGGAGNGGVCIITEYFT